MKTSKPVLVSILGTLLSAAAFVFWGIKKRDKSPDYERKMRETERPVRVPTNGELYKTRGIKHLELKDIPESISPSDASITFKGKALLSPTEHDKYNVDILDDNGTFVGRTGKNRRLYHSLSEWHKRQVFAFGKILKSDREDNTTGVVYIPAGFNEKQINELKSIFEKLQKREQTLGQDTISSKEYLTILDDHEFISKKISQLGITDEIDPTLSKKIIPTLSKQMEEEQDWNGLLELEKHGGLINELSERFAGSTYRRIGKAKKMKGLKQ